MSYDRRTPVLYSFNMFEVQSIATIVPGPAGFVVLSEDTTSLILHMRNAHFCLYFMTLPGSIYRLAPLHVLVAIV
jgi:hypothetical protein